MSIKAVIFDADGVLIFPWRFGDYLQREWGISRQMTTSFFQGAFNDCLVGTADLKTILPPFLSLWGWPGTVDQFVAAWLKEEDAIDKRLVEVIHSLRRGGLKCCLATSQEHYRANYMRDQMGFANLFDALFFSCEIGCQKPDPAFYETITQTLGLAGSEILFWDDSLKNVEGARACGWRAEVYTNFKDFTEKLPTYLNIPEF